MFWGWWWGYDGYVYDWIYDLIRIPCLAAEYRLV
jgi:hypothetical protein